MLKTVRAGWLKFEGGVLIALGVAALALSPAASPATDLAVGWILILSGVLGFAGIYATRGEAHPAWGVLSDVVCVVAGLVLIGDGLTGGRHVALIAIAYLAADGLALILLGQGWRGRGRSRWTWIAAAGIVDWLLAIPLVFAPAGSAHLFVALAVGVDLCAAGAALGGIGAQGVKED